MKQKVYHVVFSTMRVIVMVAFLSTIFIANANLAFAASDKEKPPKVARTSAIVHTEAQIKQLQGALKITAAQETLWNNLTTVMRENAKEMDALAKNRHENKKPMNAVEHMKFHRHTTETHLNQLNKFLPPFEALYASMSDEQKKITDTIFQSGKPGKHKRK
jgi:periplasmic protein CpxP/Spy